MTNFSRGKLTWHQSADIPTATIIVAAGAGGWIDTDCSAIVGTQTNRIWFIQAWNAIAGYAGARQHGSSNTAYVASYQNASFLCQCDVTGHIDLYRQAGGDVHYRFVGYLE